MSGKRSAFLLHWTGKAITTKFEELDDVKRRAYVDLLAAILAKGVRLTKMVEIAGYADVEAQVQGTTAWHVRAACFTEIRLSQARFHTREYGLAGLGFTREWVLRRFGGPVHYVRGRPTEGDPISEHVLSLARWFAIRKDDEGADAHEREDLRKQWRRAIELLTFLKRMSGNSAEDNFLYLHEHEWRVGLLDRLKATDLLGQDGDHSTLLIRPEDVRLLVFPDAATQTIAMDHDGLRPFVRREPVPPIMMTLDDAQQF